MKRFLHWLQQLLSDSHFASIRRFIGIQAFYLLIAIVIVAIVTNTVFVNMSIIAQIASYLFAIVMGTIVGTTVTDLAATIKASQLKDESDKYEGFQENPYYNAYNPSEKEDEYNTNLKN